MVSTYTLTVPQDTQYTFVLVLFIMLLWASGSVSVY